MTKKMTTLILASLIAYFCCFALVSAALATAQVSSIQSSDAYGASKDFFTPTEDAYANGTGFPCLTTADIYIVNHTTWVDKMKIPSGGIKTTVVTGSSGAIDPTIVWHKPSNQNSPDFIGFYVE